MLKFKDFSIKIKQLFTQVEISFPNGFKLAAYTSIEGQEEANLVEVS